MKTIDRIKKDPRVAEVWNEGEDGWWVTLKDEPGNSWYSPNMETHTIHEWNLKDLWAAFKSIKRCDDYCDSCYHERNRQEYIASLELLGITHQEAFA